MLPVFSASNTIAVLPRPCRCSALVDAAAAWVSISPRMYDSVKRFEPTCNTCSFAACAMPKAEKNIHQAQLTAPAIRRPHGTGLIRKTRVGPIRFPEKWPITETPSWEDTARDPELTCDAGKYNQMRHLVGASNHCLLPINKQLCNNLINYLPES